MTHLQHLQDLIAKGKLREAIQELLAATDQNGQTDLHNSIVSQSGSFEQNEAANRNGTVSYDNYQLAFNKVKKALLHYVSEEYKDNGCFVWEKDAELPPPTADEKGKKGDEAKINISNSKNVVVNSEIKAGRDVRIGDKIEQQIINNHYAPAAPPPIPKHLNHIPKITPPKIIGRDKDVADVRRLLVESKALVIVNGLGGMGKTVLSHYYWEQYKGEYQHLIWLNGENDTAGSLLNDTQLHRSLHITDRIKPYLDAMKEGKYAEARTEALDVLEQALKGLAQPCLMLIDNADEQHFWAIKEWAENLPNFHILITSRQEMSNVDTYVLGGLNEADALALFYLYYDPKSSHKRNDAIVAQICQIAGYHTLTIELLAKNLRNRHDLTLEALRTDLNKQVVYLPKKAIVETQYNQSRDYIDGILEYCFSLSQLESDVVALYLLLQLSVLPAYGVKAKHLRQILEVSDEISDAYEAAMQTLIQKGWVQYYYEDDYYYNCHAVIQEIVRKKLNADAGSCGGIIEFLIRKIYDLLNENPLKAAEWLPYGDSVLQKISDETPNIAILANNIALIYQAMGDLQKSLDFGLKAIAIQEKVLPPRTPRFSHFL